MVVSYFQMQGPMKSLEIIYIFKLLLDYFIPLDLAILELIFFIIMSMLPNNFIDTEKASLRVQEFFYKTESIFHRDWSIGTAKTVINSSKFITLLKVINQEISQFIEFEKGFLGA